MKDATILHEISPKQLRELFDNLQAQLTDLKQKYEPKNPAEYLTRAELAKILKCDLSTIHNWTKKGKLKPYAIGNRVYYKRSEVENSLKRI